MNSEPYVSVIIIFLNAERFLEEAILSVLEQTNQHFELILVDDGSGDSSTTVALAYADLYPKQVKYLEHPEHRNMGKGASRNLGIQNAQGDYIAFLDADDIWLPNKVEEQLAIMEDNPTLGMLYGDTLYWSSWTQSLGDNKMDFIPELGIQTNTLYDPPDLLPMYLRGKAAVPCTCSIILRREVFDKIGGFEEQFKGISNIYEDQAFYAKVCLNSTIMATNVCWDKYRQHPDASVAVADKLDQEIDARKFYLNWLEMYLEEQQETNSEVWVALNQEHWRLYFPTWLPSNQSVRNFLRWMKKWFLRIEGTILTNNLHTRIWRIRR